MFSARARDFRSLIALIYFNRFRFNRFRGQREKEALSEKHSRNTDRYNLIAFSGASAVKKRSTCLEY